MLATKDLDTKLHETLDDLLTDFVATLPRENYPEFGDYCGYAENQKGLFKDNKFSDPEEFWELAQIKFKHLPTVGKNLSKIPAVFPK